MSNEDRDRAILALLDERKVASVAELAALLRVSDMTVRRDINRLAAEGRLMRHHGGAAATRTPSYEPPFFIRHSENTAGKEAVGRAIADRVEPGEMLFLDVGNTTLEVAKHLDPDRNLTVLTNFIPIAVTLAQRKGFHVHLLGGTVREKELSIVGAAVQENLRPFYVDRAIIGVGGVTSDRGLTDYSLDEIAVKRTVINSAQRTIIAADSGKFGRVAPVEVCPLAQVHEIVTSEGAPEETVRALQAKGIRVTVATLAAPSQFGR
jgi:DeoR/GlpR family transcriptional regulator of sugar metabolism